jgi:hypothetical protein
VSARSFTLDDGLLDRLSGVWDVAAKCVQGDCARRSGPPRWLVSRPSLAAISSADSSKSNALMFSAMRLGLVDSGMTERPCCRPQVGLPIYGDNRSVPGLRREEVALLAGVSVDYRPGLRRTRAPLRTALGTRAVASRRAAVSRRGGFTLRSHSPRAGVAQRTAGGTSIWTPTGSPARSARPFPVAAALPA